MNETCKGYLIRFNRGYKGRIYVPDHSITIEWFKNEREAKAEMEMYAKRDYGKTVKWSATKDNRRKR